MPILNCLTPLLRFAALAATMISFGVAASAVVHADDTKPEAPPPEISNPDYELSVSVKKPRVSVGEPIPVRFAVKNTGIREVPVIRSHPLCIHRIEIVHQDKKQSVPFTTKGEQIFKICQEGSHSGQPLKPGAETVSTLENLAEIYDLERPGEYTLSVTRRVFSQVDPKQSITIRAPKLKFTVVPKE